MVRHIQDTEWRKFQAAHRRAHSKRGEEHSVRESRGDKRKEMGKKHKIRQVVRLVVVGGLAYYIGYHKEKNILTADGIDVKIGMIENEKIINRIIIIYILVWTNRRSIFKLF